jgi:hypothetical protein
MQLSKQTVRENLPNLLYKLSERKFSRTKQGQVECCIPLSALLVRDGNMSIENGPSASSPIDPWPFDKHEQLASSQRIYFASKKNIMLKLLRQTASRFMFRFVAQFSFVLLNVSSAWDNRNATNFATQKKLSLVPCYLFIYLLNFTSFIYVSY